MTLVHMEDLGLAAEGVEESDSAEAEDGLLTEAVVGVAAIEVVGEAAVPGVIAFDVGVKQEDGDDVTGYTEDIEAPGADENFPALHGEGDDLLGAGEGGLGGPGDVGLGLLADGVEVLTEVAAAVRERDSNHGGGSVGRGAEGVAGEHAQSAGVGGEGRGEGDLHGEVSDGAGSEVQIGGGLRGGGLRGGHARMIPI